MGLWGCCMRCIGKNIANCPKIPPCPISLCKQRAVRAARAVTQTPTGIGSMDMDMGRLEGCWSQGITLTCTPLKGGGIRGEYLMYCILLAPHICGGKRDTYRDQSRDWGGGGFAALVKPHGTTERKLGQRVPPKMAETKPLRCAHSTGHKPHQAMCQTCIHGWHHWL